MQLLNGSAGVFLQLTDRSERGTFLTTVPGQPVEDEQVPDYLRNADVPASLLADIKKKSVKSSLFFFAIRLFLSSDAIMQLLRGQPCMSL